MDRPTGPRGPADDDPPEAAEHSGDNGRARLSSTLDVQFRNASFRMAVDIGQPRPGATEDQESDSTGSEAHRHRPLADYRDHARRALFPGWARRKNRRPRPGIPSPPAAPRGRPEEHQDDQPVLMDSSAITFWDALTPAEQYEFRSMADDRIFPCGATLMEKGETADYVIVIVSGVTRVYTEDDGVNRIIARRGPGEVIGERAALRVAKRSATVAALEPIRALVMTTEDFASFLNRHPAVLHLLEEQIYGRLTETPSRRYGGDSYHGQYAGPEVVPRSGHPAPGLPLTGEIATVVFTDVVAFGATWRTEGDRRIVRRQLLSMTSASLRPIWDEVLCEDRGDGHLLVVRSAVPPAEVLEYLLIALPIALKEHNSIYRPGIRIQLRAALATGPVTSDSPGVSGRVIIDSARLLDAPAFKEAITASRADLGIIVSDDFYQNVVRDADHVTDPASYTEIDVSVKEASLRARMTLVYPPFQVPPPRKALVTL